MFKLFLTQKPFLRGITFLSLLLLLVSVSCTQPPASETFFRFAFMTDIHVQPERRADEGFRAAIAKVNELHPDFVITGGDLIMDALEEPYERADSLYTLYQTICADFQMPVYNTIGNHEVFGLFETSGVDPEHPMYGKEMFKTRLGDGKTYTSFDHKGWHFILLDVIAFTEDRRYYGYVDSTQLQWLGDDLNKAGKDTPIVVSLHIPLVSVYTQMTKGATEAATKSRGVTNSLEVLNVLKDYNLKLVLQGHLHIVEEIVYKDVHYVTCGAVSGAWWKGPRDDFPEGFVVVDVKGDEFTWEYTTYGWQAVAEEK